ncbi:MAG: hypothetical protein BAJATHORv1_30436 [Candidatus Thorarchaeota archaeon]|nr:MAG: hypothetical protein BAJATHORv1_30436 [Candidatus Thorarchaeota archaeon]
MAKQFYRFLSHIQEGGLRRDIARISCTHRKNVDNWIKCQLPRLPRLASEIPRFPTPHNWMWLPISTKGKSFTNWIKVPFRVKYHDAVRYVLSQISSVETKQMRDWTRSFGKISKSNALGYVLGVICSDGYFQRKSVVERVALNLSKTYDWSKNFGDGFCYCLGRIGINAHQIADSISLYEWDDSIRESYTMNWISESSPILNWIKRSCLGFQLKGSKSNIDAEWIIDAPKDFRICFIQGVSDGDGTVTSMLAEISTTSEGEFYSRVLDSLGFSTKFSDSRVLIHRVEDIPKAAHLPLFKFASGRQKKLNHLSRMTQVSSEAGYMSESEKELIQSLIKQDYGRSEIRFKIWEELRISRSEVAIWRFKKSLDDSQNPEQND